MPRSRIDDLLRDYRPRRGRDKPRARVVRGTDRGFGHPARLPDDETGLWRQAQWVHVGLLVCVPAVIAVGLLERSFSAETRSFLTHLAWGVGVLNLLRSMFGRLRVERLRMAEHAVREEYHSRQWHRYIRPLIALLAPPFILYFLRLLSTVLASRAIPTIVLGTLTLICFFPCARQALLWFQEYYHAVFSEAVTRQETVRYKFKRELALGSLILVAFLLLAVALPWDYSMTTTLTVLSIAVLLVIGLTVFFINPRRPLAAIRIFCMAFTELRDIQQIYLDYPDVNIESGPHRLAGPSRQISRITLFFLLLGLLYATLTIGLGFYLPWEHYAAHYITDAALPEASARYQAYQWIMFPVEFAKRALSQGHLGYFGVFVPATVLMFLLPNMILFAALLPAAIKALQLRLLILRLAYEEDAKMDGQE